jgi:hypothetical protein
VTKTHIIDILAKMLSFKGEEELIYYMRLEALWILQNIAFGDSEVVDLILIEAPN